MALTRTTLSAAVTVTDKAVRLASITGLAANMPLVIDGEEMRIVSVPSSATLPVPVLRGVNGTAVAAHASGASAVFGPPEDFTSGSAPRLAARQRVITSISASGAIPINTPGTDQVVVLNGTSVIAATLAVPGKANDGDRLQIVANGAAAHTVTVAGGLSDAGSSYDVITFNGTKRTSLEFVAMNETWVPICQPAMGGTVTNIIGSIA